MGGVLRAEDREDLRPETSAAPLLVPGVHGMPRAEVVGHFAPGGTGAHDPEHPRQELTVILRRATHRRRRWQERRDPLPLRIGHVLIRGREGLHARAAGGRGMRPSPPRGVAALGSRLMAPPEGRPRQPEGPVFGRLGMPEQQAAHLRDGQGDQIVRSPPFSPSLAWRRVTSK